MLASLESEGAANDELVRWLALAFVLIAAPVPAQEPPGRRPRPRPTVEAGPGVHELLPDIGKIGAQVGCLGGASWNPYEVGSGFAAAASSTCRSARARRQALLRDPALAQLAPSSPPFVITDAVAFVANLAAGASPGGRPRGPAARAFPGAARGDDAAAPAPGLALRPEVDDHAGSTTRACGPTSRPGSTSSS